MSDTWVQGAVALSLSVLGAGVTLAFWRLIKGPSHADRIVALDLLGLQAIGLILVHAVGSRNEGLIDVAIVVAVLIFLGTAAMAHYLSRR
jgi:multicomponent Na+:H+ antiporter subunit F